jgi:hypothetical protein
MMNVQVGSLQWEWGSLWGGHFFRDLLRMGRADTSLGASARSALKESLSGERSIQEIIHGHADLTESFEWKAEMEDAKSFGAGERYRRGVTNKPGYEKYLKPEWYRHEGLRYGKMVGED